MVGAYGTEEGLPALEPLLGNTGYRMGIRRGKTTLATRTGDVALAAMVHIRGAKLADYGLKSSLTWGLAEVPADRIGLRDGA